MSLSVSFQFPSWRSRGINCEGVLHQGIHNAFIIFMRTFQEKTDKEHGKQVKNIVKKENKKRKKMKELGIDYEFPGYVSHRCVDYHKVTCNWTKLLAMRSWVFNSDHQELNIGACSEHLILIVAVHNIFQGVEAWKIFYGVFIQLSSHFYLSLPNTFPMLNWGLKNLEFQLVLWASSCHICLFWATSCSP